MVCTYPSAFPSRLFIIPFPTKITAQITATGLPMLADIPQVHPHGQHLRVVDEKSLVKLGN